MNNVVVAELYTGDISNNENLEQVNIINMEEGMLIDTSEQYKKEARTTVCIVAVFAAFFIGVIIYLMRF